MQGCTNETRSRHSNKYAFSGKLVCGNCGSKLRRKRWGQSEKYKKYVWICVNHANHGNEACDMKAVDEEKLKVAFMRSINKIIQHKDTFIKSMLENINKILDGKEEDGEFQEINSRLEELKEQMLNLVRLNVRSSLDNQIYDEEYQRIEQHIQELKHRKAAFDNKELIRDKALKKAEEVEKILGSRNELLRRFDEGLFTEMVEQVRITSLVEVEYIYKTGLVIKEIL